jgi:hypothetical protein
MPALVPISRYFSGLRGIVGSRAESRTLSPRFWDETNKLLGLYAHYRELDDNANALPCFSALAKYSFDELLSRPNYDPRKKSIISVFQPKSGGTFLNNRLLQLGYQEYWWLFVDRYCHSMCYASDEALDYFMRGGCTCHTHARPDPNILAALDRAGVRKIWVHLRNPAESVVSTYHHYLGEGQGEGEIGAQRRAAALVDAERQGLAPGVSKSEFVVDTVAWCVKWVAEWLRFAQQRPGLVVFSYHRELADVPALFKRVFGELGVRLKGSVSAEILGHDRFRLKGSDDWREELTGEAQKYVEARVRAELECFPQFAQLWR